MVRIIYITSIVILVVLAGIIIYPKIKGLFKPPVDLNMVEQTYQEFITENGLTDPIPDLSIVVTKSNRMVYLLSGDQSVGRWRCALGRNPEGPKQLENDGKTPEGGYIIIDRDNDSDYHLFLAINYPGRHDADAARRDEIIDDRMLRDIYRFITQVRMPPQDTPLGGGIGIQGGGVVGNWTDGSIAVEDDVIEILWAACPDGAEVTIYAEFNDWDLSDRMLASE
jgi:murein L,D-transpeptidase YafK